MMAEKAQLENELEYLTKLLKKHKESVLNEKKQAAPSSSSRLPSKNSPPRQPSSSSQPSKNTTSLQGGAQSQAKKALLEKAKELELVLKSMKNKSADSLIKSKSVPNSCQKVGLPQPQKPSFTTPSNGLSDVKSSQVKSVPYQQNSSSHRYVASKAPVKAPSGILHKSSSSSAVSKCSNFASSNLPNSSHSPSKFHFVKCATVPANLDKSSAMKTTGISKTSAVLPERTSKPLPVGASDVEKQRDLPVKVIAQKGVQSASAETKRNSELKKCSTTLDDLVQKQKDMQTAFAESRDKLQKSIPLRKNWLVPSKSKSEKLVRSASAQHVSSVSSQTSGITQVRNVNNAPVCYKTKHKLVKKSQRSTGAKGASTPVSRSPRSSPKHSPYKFIKNNSSQEPAKLAKPIKLDAAKVNSRYKFVRTPITPGNGEKRIKRRRTLSGQKQFVSPRIHMQSRYKLVKKAIETANRAGREARPSTRLQNKNTNRYPKPKRTRFALVRDKTETTSHGTVDINKVLGRTVDNVSRNKYKFIKQQPNRLKAQSTKRWNNPMLRKINSKNTYRIPNRNLLKTSLRGNTRSRHKVINRTTVVMKHQRRGSKHRVSVSRLALTGPSVTVARARQCIARSIWTAKTSRLRQQSKYCLFYNRFGKCNRGNKCPNIHDPARIAICTRFLRGTCSVTACPFSHRLAPSKVPTCRFFLRGRCHSDACPYLHVNVGKDAQVCTDFLDGLCPLGDKCKKSHNPVCPEFESRGQCSRGRQCRMLHEKRNVTRRRKQAADADDNMVPAKKARVTEDEKDDRNLPMSQRSLPTYITLDSPFKEVVETESPCMSPKLKEEPTRRQIKPRFFLD